jgi:hypothetical protein
MNVRRFAHAAVLGGFALMLAGCGGDDSPASAAGSSAPSTTGTATAGATPPASAGPSRVATAGPPPASPTTRRTPGPPSRRTPGPSVAVSTLPPAPVGTPAPLRRDVAVTVVGVRDLEVGAVGPGEIAGHAVSVQVQVRNLGSSAFNLSGLTVNAYYGRDIPASPTSAGGADPLSGSLAAGGTATGTYVFLVPADQSSTVRVEVSSADSAMIAVFQR